MKKNKIIIGLLILIAILITPKVDAQTHGELLGKNDNKIQVMEDLLEDENVLNEIDKYMLEKYGDKYKEKLDKNEQSVLKASKIEINFPHNKYGEAIYPSYMGGLYIDDNDDLIVEIVKKNIPKNDSKNYSNYESVMKIANDAKIKYVEYSYEELNNLNTLILDKYLGKNNDITGLYVDVASNKVVVELKNYNSESVKKFKENIMDSPMISFDQGMVFENIGYVSPGGAFTSNTGSGCSYGYRAKTKAGVVGIVSAGHCFSGVGATIPNMGTVTKWQDDGGLDMAFIATNSSTTPTNSLEFNNACYQLSTALSLSLVNGQLVSKIGKTTGYTSGTILSTNYSYTQGGVTYSYLIRTSMSANNGDSGGISFQPTNGENKTLGIMKAKSSNGNQSLVTAAYRITAIYALSRY